MTEQLTARLASLGSWRVASPAAALRYRGTRKPIAQIATELGVDAVLEGSVARHGSSVSVAARLVDARTGRRIWGDAYEQGIDNVLVAQNDLVRAIARETDLRLAPDVSTRLSSTPRTVAPAAYDAYVRGRHAWDKRSESALHDAIRFFQDSIDADPTYAPAYAGLADAYAQLGYGSYVSPEDTFPRARSAAEKALTLDPSLAERHASRGYALMTTTGTSRPPNRSTDARSSMDRLLSLNRTACLVRVWPSSRRRRRPSISATLRRSNVRRLQRQTHLRFRPLLQMHIDLAPLFRVTQAAGRAKTFVLVRWDFEAPRG